MFVLTKVNDKIRHDPISLVINPRRMRPSTVRQEWHAAKLKMLFVTQLVPIQIFQTMLVDSLGICCPSEQ